MLGIAREPVVASEVLGRDAGGPQQASELAVELSATRLEDALERRISHQRVAKADHVPGRAALAQEDPPAAELVQQRVELLGGHLGHLRENVQSHGLAGDGDLAQQPLERGPSSSSRAARNTESAIGAPVAPSGAS